MSIQPVSATQVSELKNKIEQRQARVAVIGLGYVGLPLALLYAESGFPVTGFDIDQRKVSTLEAGGSYIFRITAPEIQRARSQGFTATSEYAQLETMDAVIICVPTPLNEYHEPDLSYITSTAESIAPHLQAGQLVILESTTYPGTTEEVLVPILEKGNRHGLKAARGGESDGKSFFVAFSPEREDPGNQTVARRDIPKVVGGVNPQASELAGALNQHKKALNGSKVLVLGVAYKKDIDDLRESPALTIIELLQKEGALVSYNDPYFPEVGRGRKYDLQMKCAPLESLGQYDCVLIVTDHSDYDYERIVRESKLVVDTRKATRGIQSDKIVHC